MSDRKPHTHPLVTVSGAGSIGESVLAGLLGSGHPADRLRATVRTAERAEHLARSYAVEVTTDNARAALGADVLVLAVRPDQAEAVLAETVPRLASGAAVVSLVAGLPLDRIAPAGATPVHAFRVATNAVSIDRSGLLAVTPGRDVPEPVRNTVTGVLRRLGRVVTITEPQQDTAASTLGSGAAFLALTATGIDRAATEAGVSPDVARAFAADALESAAAMLRGSDPTSTAAWDGLATPGGITEAGLGRLLSAGAVDAMADAVRAAVTRAAELALPATP
ncbi:hypothetical protein F2B00_09685 [Streptomyces parvus]|uniref:pyrroline-5-carboxylate reductase family protein n=1 Tax=Streptomyces parvus TaxID=66428 RepID=UPI00123A3A68|nr:pyrroline-5-carboxylate reductase dimerization domain-containing protein [Streptomyces parvus]KAA6202453.1 hypothetical protein F2B00_09685 [Streptomyces parvus]GGS49314.1 pyrroline-5-carboxylate reductase [Streptomyces parvus]